jgi:NCAIR mutase (PurE)-related protein
MSDFLLDVARTERLGFGEAIFCAGKTAEQIDAILEDGNARGLSLLLTRLEPARAALLRHESALDYDAYSRTAFAGAPAPAQPASVAVVAAGTSDLPVAREAVRTLAFHGVSPTEISDVGVAGLWRLLQRVEELRHFAVVIAVAGMDAALPTVLGGLIPGCLIAVPTSVGYGAAAGGQAALNAMLASCAPGVLVTNIDNGYGAATAALRMVLTMRRLAGTGLATSSRTTHFREREMTNGSA